jgi:hypothetical protein
MADWLFRDTWNQSRPERGRDRLDRVVAGPPCPISGLIGAAVTHCISPPAAVD